MQSKQHDKYLRIKDVSITDGTSKALLAPAREVVVARMLPSVYQQLEKKHSRLVITTASTPLEVSYQLGVQAVLADLRNGYVVES